MFTRHVSIRTAVAVAIALSGVAGVTAAAGPAAVDAELREGPSVAVAGRTAPMLFDLVDRAMCAAGRTNHEIIAYTAKKQNGLSFYGRVALTCGDEHVGYRHIKIKHSDQWLEKLVKYGGRGSWDDFMSFATAQALAHPSLVRNVGSGKYCYTTPIQLYQGGQLVNTFYPRVIVSTTTRRVITSYPASDGLLMKIRLMNDYAADLPVWDQEGGLDAPPDGVSDALEAALRAWAANFNEHFSEQTGWPSAQMEREHRAEGERLLALLQQALPNDVITLNYWEKKHQPD